MSRRPSSSEYEERRNARIRQLREQREGPVRRRRRVEPVLLLAWIAGSIALLVVAIVLGFNLFFAPRVMAWVEENPGAIEHGLVQDFVRWYQPDLLTDEPASDEQRRVTVEVVQGATDTAIGQLLFEEGLIKSQVAFQYAVITSNREGTLAFGVFDLFPTMRPSEIVATLQGQPFGEVTTVTIREGLRLEEIVAAFAESNMTMNMEEFAAILQAPPVELLNEFDFLADLPDGRSLEGYIPPETIEFEVGAEAIDVVRALLTQFDEGLTDEIMAGLAERKPDPRPGGHHRQHCRARGGHPRGAAAHRGGLHRAPPEPRQRDHERPPQRGPDAPVRPHHRRAPTRGAPPPRRNRGRVPPRGPVGGGPRVVAAAPGERRRGRTRRGAPRLPDLHAARAASHADRRPPHRLAGRRGQRAGRRRLPLLRGRLPGRQPRRIALLRADPAGAHRERRARSHRVRRPVTATLGSRTDTRLAALRQLLSAHRLDAALISRSANKRWFSGFRLSDAEGPTSGWAGTLLVTDDASIILADSRYTEQAANEAPAWSLVSTAGAMRDELPRLLLEHEVESLGMEASVVSHADWAALAEAAPGVELHAIDDELAPLRLIKSADEVDAIGRACALTDACFSHLLEFVRAGMTESEVAWEIEGFFRANGAEGVAFDTIVLAGPRAAMPHGRPTDAVVAPGNVLLIDFGCIVDGYRSDMTRTLFVGDVPNEIQRWHDAVREAQAAAIDALAVGADGQEIDAIARERIAREGVEPYGHGLGHGIGMETHERPSLRRSVSATLEAGMVFSVEPGIYLPGVTGIRIEDIVALEESGPRLLMTSPREPLVIS